MFRYLSKVNNLTIIEGQERRCLSKEGLSKA
jgi:hypothetical protein